MAIRESVIAPIGGDHRDAGRLREGDQVVGRAGAGHAPPGQDQRALGGEEEIERRRHVVRARGGVGRDGARAEVGLRELALGVEHIGRDGEEDRAGSPADRPPRRLVDIFRQALGRRHLGGPLADVRVEGREFDLLEGLAVPIGRLDLPDDRDQRRRVLIGGVEGDRHVGRADAARGHAEGRLPGQLADRLGGEGRALLVARRDQLDLIVIVEGIEDREKTLARHRERLLDPLAFQLRDHRARPGHPCHHPHPSPLRADRRAPGRSPNVHCGAHANTRATPGESAPQTRPRMRSGIDVDVHAENSGPGRAMKEGYRR